MRARLAGGMSKREGLGGRGEVDEKSEEKSKGDGKQDHSRVLARCAP